MVMLVAPEVLKTVLPEVPGTAMQKSLHHQVVEPHQVVERGTLDKVAGKK